MRSPTDRQTNRVERSDYGRSRGLRRRNTGHMHRRQFLAAAAGGLWTGSILAQERKGSVNERLALGVIGTNGQGLADTQAIVAAGAEVVALCDVDENRATDARKRYPQAAFYTDFRKMLDAEHKRLDAVLVATPDHTHAVATMAALRLGLHVFCEKPLTHDVYEARQVALAAAYYKRTTQMGTQIHAGSNSRRVVELIRANAIGTVREVHVWCDKVHSGGDRPKETPPVPAGLHYDLWLGPAPYRPYHPAHLHFVWRGWWDFGGGTLADMGCHYIDLPFWALELQHPERIYAEGSPVHPDACARWLIVRYEFPARGTWPPVRLTWYDGGKRPPYFQEGLLPRWGDGVLFVGDKGMLLADYTKHKLLPEKQFENFTRPKPTIPESVGHYREWVLGCKTGAPTTCHFGYAGALTETVLLGLVSYRLGRPITWDWRNLCAINEPKAEEYIRREYRKGWHL